MSLALHALLAIANALPLEPHLFHENLHIYPIRNFDRGLPPSAVYMDLIR
ncbi:hypothetical protein SAMN04487906_0194 [Zhouia amylolytica]|uniref:Uncharacterized protein n=1 Tax=Zhouia amylolytica TaxID=376730 RepID=A0A1I6PA73_9FLAO|nr:hypothetical protein SAMN04487906_0194 [Zhouia amylolytica]